jgi:hypothetical protein
VQCPERISDNAEYRVPLIKVCSRILLERTSGVILLYQNFKYIQNKMTEVRPLPLNIKNMRIIPRFRPSLHHKEYALEQACIWQFLLT